MNKIKRQGKGRQCTCRKIWWTKSAHARRLGEHKSEPSCVCCFFFSLSQKVKQITSNFFHCNYILSFAAVFVILFACTSICNHSLPLFVYIYILLIILLKFSSHHKIVNQKQLPVFVTLE